MHNYIISSGAHRPKVLRWYQAHSFDVTPIHPKEAEIERIGAHPNVAAFLTANPDVKAEDVAISVITPPTVSLKVVKEGITRQNVSTIWLQVSKAARCVY